MSEGLDRALAHYGDLPRRCIEVAEWGGEEGPLVIYWKPWTTWEKRELYKAGRGDEHKMACRVVVRKSLNAEGKRLFEDADANHLERGAHDAVVAYVAARIIADLDADAAVDGDIAILTSPAAMGSKEAVEAAEKK